MTYRVYSGPKGTPEFSPIDKQQLLFKEFGTLDEALAWAHHVERGGRIALQIDSDDGTSMNRREIGAALASGKHEQVGD